MAINPFLLKNKPFETFPRVGQMWPKLNQHSSLLPGLISVWPIVDKGGYRLWDEWGNHDAIFSGGSANPAWGDNAEWGPFLDFDGASDEVPIASAPHLTTWSIVIAFLRWDGDPGAGTYPHAFAKGGLFTNDSSYCVTYRPSIDRVSLRVKDGATLYSCNATYSLETAAIHFVGTWKNGSQKIYINGIEKGSTTNAGAGSDGGHAGYFGRSTSLAGSEIRWNGPIGTTSLYNRVLDAAAVKTLYEQETRWQLLQPQTPRFAMSVAVAGGLSIPVAMRSYRNRRLGNLAA